MKRFHDGRTRAGNLIGILGLLSVNLNLHKRKIYALNVNRQNIKKNKDNQLVYFFRLQVLELRTCVCVRKCVLEGGGRAGK